MARTGPPLRLKKKASTENREQDDVTDRQPSLEHGSNLTANDTRNRQPPHLSLIPIPVFVLRAGGMMLV